MSEIVLEAKGLVKVFADAGEPVTVLSGLDLRVHAGEVLAVTGSSGSGKSTLLHILGALDAFDSGSVAVAGRNLAGLDEDARSALRNRSIGFVYQFHHLLPELTALENVAMPLRIARMPEAKALARAAQALAAVGLESRARHHPAQLSGGQRQRCAIARALVTEPALVLADEPTGNLDNASARSVFELFMRLSREKGVAVVVVTHDRELARLCDRVLELENGVFRL